MIGDCWPTGARPDQIETLQEIAGLLPLPNPGPSHRRARHDVTTGPLPLSACRGCGGELDDATPVTERGAVPSPGAVSICMYCGALSLFDEQLALRAPTPEEISALAADPEIQRIVRGWAELHLEI